MKIFIPKEGMLPDSYFPEKKNTYFPEEKNSKCFSS